MACRVVFFALLDFLCAEADVVLDFDGVAVCARTRTSPRKISLPQGQRHTIPSELSLVDSTRVTFT